MKNVTRKKVFLWSGLVFVATMLFSRRTSNSDVLAILNQIPKNTGFAQDGGTGMPGNFYFKGKKFYSGDNKLYCSGITLWVALTIAEHRGLLKDKKASDINGFSRVWYGRPGEKYLSGEAIPKYGLGRAVSPSEAKAGDFLQLWRTDGTGHSVIFLGWEFDQAGQVKAIRYFSAQPKTNGAGICVEKVSKRRGHVRPDMLYFARLF